MHAKTAIASNSSVKESLPTGKRTPSSVLTSLDSTIPASFRKIKAGFRAIQVIRVLNGRVEAEDIYCENYGKQILGDFTVSELQKYSAI